MPKTEHYSEKELVEGCLRNQREAQEMLYRKYFASMMRMCMRYTQDRDLAMEIVSTGFLRVFTKLHTFSFSGSLEGWIRRLVFHSLSDHFRRKAQPARFLELEDRDAPIPEGALDRLYLEDLLRMVEQLPEATKEVFVLYAIEGFTHAEIGEKLEISVGTSKWHLSMARQKLKQLIQRDYNIRNYAG
jgi:RNA polymerase sigma-70 factor (ECF subfamily)